jgi:hypothetical protein
MSPEGLSIFTLGRWFTVISREWVLSFGTMTLFIHFERSPIFWLLRMGTLSWPILDLHPSRAIRVHSTPRQLIQITVAPLGTFSIKQLHEPSYSRYFRWMAPELLNPEISGNNAARASEASDVYAFAMVMIEVFTGNMGFNLLHMLVPEITAICCRRSAIP